MNPKSLITCTTISPELRRSSHLSLWAIEIVEHETVSGLPEDFEPYVEMIRSYAREVVAAPDLKSAAKSVSGMARTCGNCHQVNEVELEFGFDTKPPEWADTISLMQRHQWAAERLWEGLIGPSDVAWSRGTDMLVDVPLRPAAATSGLRVGRHDKWCTLRRD